MRVNCKRSVTPTDHLFTTAHDTKRVKPNITSGQNNASTNEKCSIHDGVKVQPVVGFKKSVLYNGKLLL